MDTRHQPTAPGLRTRTPGAEPVLVRIRPATITPRRLRLRAQVTQPSGQRRS